LQCGSDSRIEVFDPFSSSKVPKASFDGDAPFTSISHHREQPSVAASLAHKINLYDLTRTSSKPTQTISWQDGISSINAVRFNQVETSILASCAIDRSIVLYDVRTSSALHRTTLTFACNAISWNPQEAFNFAVGSEDHNIYHFDMRQMRRALNVQKGHVAAVMALDFSPTGQSLVSGSYDRTIRIFDRAAGSSRDMYHTKRQQRVFSVAWSGDNNFVLSGSDDGNIRLWRAVASSRQGVKSFAQRQKLEYDDKLKQRYGHMPEIKRILRHRHLPKTVKKANEIKNEELRSLKRRAENERKHSKKGLEKRRPEREKMVLGQDK
jgi:WD repeat and SOF domain-containing protein 1